MKTDPWMVAILAYIVPGLGQWYLRRRYLGAVIFIVVVSLISLGVQQILSYGGNTALGWGLMGWGIIIWAIGLAHSIVLVIRQRRLADQSKEEKYKSPYLAIILSYILPGIGQLYAKDVVNAIPFFAGVVFAKIALSKIASSFVVEALGALSALLATRKLRLITSDTGRQVILIVLLLLSSETLRTAMNAIVWSPHLGFLARIGGGDSMKPTLEVGDIMLRDREFKSKLSRGDIIDFRSMRGEVLCKRLIAFAGEEVSIEKGEVYINGGRLRGAPYDSFYYTTDSIDVFDSGKKTYVVAAGCVFVLGDNSKDSEDSRYLGGVKVQTIISVIYKVIYPLNREKVFSR